jgi:hypothetical protein
MNMNRRNPMVCSGLSYLHSAVHGLDEEMSKDDHRFLHLLINMYRLRQGEEAINWQQEEGYLYEYPYS